MFSCVDGEQDPTPGFVWEDWSANLVGGAEPICTYCSSNGQIVYVGCASGGGIQKSVDGGVTFTKLSASDTSNWANISCSADGTVVLASYGVSGLMLASTDGGATWATTGTTARSWRGVAVERGGGAAWATTNDGLMYRAANPGGGFGTWTAMGTAMYSSKVEPLADASGNSYVIAAGYTTLSGVKYQTEVSEYLYPVVPPVQVTSVAGAKDWIDVAGNTYVRYMVATSDYLYVRSIGNSWTTSIAKFSDTTALPLSTWKSVCCGYDLTGSTANSSRAFASNGNQGTYVTRDYGSTWQQSSTVRNLSHLCCSQDGTTVYAVTTTAVSPRKFYKSTGVW